MKSDKISPVLLVVLGVSLGLFGFILIIVNPFGWKLEISNPFKSLSKTAPSDVIPTPTPYPLAHGKQTYTISGHLPNAPQISAVVFDPIDPAAGDSLNITVKAVDTTGVKTVSVILNTDNKGANSQLILSEGTAENGTWKGSIKVDDSYNYIYRVVIRAKNTGGVLQSNTITIR